jgi:hypothetical protein
MEILYSTKMTTFNFVLSILFVGWVKLVLQLYPPTRFLVRMEGMFFFFFFFLSKIYLYIKEPGYKEREASQQPSPQKQRRELQIRGEIHYKNT